MSIKDVFEKDKGAFKEFDFEMWNRYYRAINAGVPVEKVSKAPYYLELSDSEKQCYVEELKGLEEERKSFPEASYEVRLKDFN